MAAARTPVRQLWGLIAASHPFPVFLVAGLTAIIGVASTRGAPPAVPLALAALGMLCGQLAIGWCNDYLDRQWDAIYQPDKPIPAGLVDARVLPPLVAFGLAGMAATSAALGPWPLVLLTVGTGAGMAYNFWFQDTRLSWLPYAVGFGSVPLFVWAALDVFRPQLGWLYLVTPPLALAAHLGNALPDVDSDRQAGRIGLIAALGRSRALGLLAACLLAPLALLALSSLWLSYDLSWLGPALAAYAALNLAGAWGYSRQPWSRAADLGFRFVGLAAVAFTAGWLASVG